MASGPVWRGRGSCRAEPGDESRKRGGAPVESPKVKPTTSHPNPNPQMARPAHPATTVEELAPHLPARPDVTRVEDASQPVVGPEDVGEGRRRVVIETVRPQVEGGAYPIKRVAGEIVEVAADVFADG